MYLHLITKIIATPAIYDHSILDMSLQHDTHSFSNDPGDKYLITRSNDYYVSRLASSGKIDIYNISTHSLLFDLFGTTLNQ